MVERITPELMERMITLHEVAVPLNVGRATVAWNTLCGTFYDLFRLLSELDDDRAKATFFSIDSDRAQRNIVARLVELRLKRQHPPLARRAMKIIGEANSLAGKRNDVLHVVFVDDLYPEKVRQLHERGHLVGKVGTDLIDAIHALTMECLDLSIRLSTLSHEVLDTRLNREALVEALLAYRPQRTAEELANQGGFGLLDVPATTPHSPDENQG